jgi:tetratricopeptide (TPR) repeat protein
MFRNKVIIFFTFFILLQSVCLGTNIDSLLQLLEPSRGIRKAELLNDLSETYLNTSAEKSIKHAIEALEISEDLNSFRERGRAYKNIGNAYNLLNVNELAILNYGKALGIYENLNNKENIADVLFQMATVYYKISDYSNALSLVKQSLLIYEELNDSLRISNSYNTIGVIYWKLSDLDKALENYMKSLIFDDEEIHNTFNNIGIIYGIQGNYDKALEYQLKALKIRREIGLMNGIAGSLNNIGIIYKFMNELDTALNYFIEALEIWGEIGQPWRLASIMNNVGSIYLAKGDYTKALDYFRKSLIYSDEAENVNEYANTLLNLGDVYLELRKYDSSLIFLQEGIILADRIQARNLMRDGYFLLHELYYQRGEYNNALEYYKEYSVVKDSIFSKQSKDKIAELRIKYETEEKEKENELLRQNNRIQILKLSREKNIRNLFIVILLLVVILIFLFFNRYTTRKKTNKILTDKNIQINRINQDLRKLNKELEIRVKERTKNFEDEIQERKQAEKIQRVLFKIARAANTAMVLRELLIVIQQEVSNILDMRNFFIVLYDREKDQLTLPYFVDEKDQFISFPEGKTLTSYVIRKKTMVLLRQDDILQLVKSGEIEQVGSMCKVWLGVPLRSESQIIGVFVIQNYEDENAFNKNDIKILEFIADQIGTMIERKSTEEKINIAKEKAEESDRLKTSFLTNMSHEIRTPMNAIIGFSNLLLKPDISQSKKSEYVEIISNNTSTLLKIIDDVIDTARIEVGEIKIEEEDCQINKILDEQLIFNKEMKVKINKQHIELRVRKGVENDNFTIRTDPYRIRQILANLISNAIKFVEE